MNDPHEEIRLGSEIDENDSVELIRIMDNEGRQMAMMMPSSMKRKLDEDQLRLVAEMQRDVRQIQKLQEHIDQVGLKARDWGMSWAAIGWSVGLTAEGARKKWSEPDE